MSKAIDIKWKDLLIAIIVGIMFLVVVQLADRYYARRNRSYAVPGNIPEGYSKTIDARINGVVAAIETFSGFVVVIDGKRFRFAAVEFKIPRGSESTYPTEFIQVGDSIIKNAKSDTFFVVRRNQRWQYFLPSPQQTRL